MGDRDGQDFSALAPHWLCQRHDRGVPNLGAVDLSGAKLAGPFAVKLRVTSLEQPEYLSFQLPSKNLPGVKALPLPAEKRLEGYSLKMTEALITPFSVYVAAEITVDAGVPMETCDRILWAWLSNVELADSNRNLALAWMDSNGAGYPLKDGNVVFPTQENDFTQSIIDPEKPVKIILSMIHDHGNLSDPLRFGDDREYVLIETE